MQEYKARRIQFEIRLKILNTKFINEPICSYKIQNTPTLLIFTFIIFIVTVFLNF